MTDLDSLSKIDLEQVKLQVAKRLGWSKDKVERYTGDYVNFLDMHFGPTVKSRPPSNEVDEVWHQHILNTEKYASDCARFLGFFLHHRPDRIQA